MGMKVLMKHEEESMWWKTEIFWLPQSIPSFLTQTRFIEYFLAKCGA